MSYLNGSYLSDELSDFDAGNATSALAAASGEAGAPEDMVQLPGGIFIPKRTLWLLLGALAVAAAIIYIRKRDRRLQRLERAADEDDE